jgi:hypothetical protein
VGKELAIQNYIHDLERAQKAKEQPKDEGVRIRKESSDRTDKGLDNKRVMNTLICKESVEERPQEARVAETEEERQVRELVELKLGKFRGEFETEQLGKVDQQLDELIDKHSKGKKKK